MSTCVTALLRFRDGRSLVLSYQGGCHGTKWIKVPFGSLFSNVFILHHMSCDEVSMRIEELKCKVLRSQHGKTSAVQHLNTFLCSVSHV